MGKYIKKPIPIDAYQVNPSIRSLLSEPDFPDWVAEAIYTDALMCPDQGLQFQVMSNEGIMTGNYGDWLMKGVRGELYICADDIFQESYEEVKS